MKRMTMIASLWVLWCLTVISCSGGKNSDLIGRYDGIGDYESSLALLLNEDKTGSEIVVLDNVLIVVPFTWMRNGNSLRFDFDLDNAVISGGDEDDQELQSNVKSLLLSTYTDSRTYTIDRSKQPLELHNSENYPNYRKNEKD
jgi:lipoprotein